MKHFKQFAANARWVIALFVLGALIGLSSCKKDNNNKPAPTLSLTSTSASNVAGAAVTTSVTVESPEGGSILAILVNGAVDSTVPDKTLDGTSSQTVDISWTIPASAEVGATYLITFQASDKKSQFSGISTFLITVSAVPPKPIKDITGNITSDRHFVADTIYRLVGFVRVGKDEVPAGGPATPVILAKATLTIDPGTIILGQTGTPGGTLIVQRGSKIMALGQAANPIVFTSEKDPGSRKAGDWGGFVLCGLAPNNTTGNTSTNTDGISELEGGYGGFHGGITGGGAQHGELDPNDNSGTIQYVRVEFAGYPINPNQEINGVTFGSVGAGTTFDHVQVTYANDDSYEWFGGTIHANHIIAYKGIDDDFDTDNGFSGRVQFGLGIRDQGIADQSGSNGFECDNDANGSSNLPITSAKFCNMTIVGGKATSGTTINLQFQNGAQIRRNAQQDIYNSLLTAYPNGIYIDNQLGSPGTISNATNGLLEFKNNILAGVENWGGNGFGSASTADERTAVTVAGGSYPYGADANHPNNPRGRVVAGGVGAFTNGAFAYTTGELQISSQAPVIWFGSLNTILSRWTDSGLDQSVFEPLQGAPTLIPHASSPLTSGADFGFDTASEFEHVTYRGAFGTTDWTTGGWVNWDPQITVYK